MIRSLSSAFVVVLIAHAAGARAQDSSVTRAEQLFREGKARLASHDTEGACPLLAESYRLDPATGSLLALALCHEQLGRLASARREYAEAERRSHAEGREDRARAARDKVQVLRARVSTLTIENVRTTAGLEVTLNGKRVEPSTLGEPIPVDGGEQIVEATAPNKQAFRRSVTVRTSHDTRRVLIPALADVQAPPAPERARPVARPRPARRDSRGLSAGEWVGAGAFGAGVVGLGLGTYFAIEASSEERVPRESCDGGYCTFHSASGADSGDRAALSFVIGGVLTVVGAVTYLVSGPAGPPESAASRRQVQASVWAAPGAAGAAVSGHF